MSTITLADLIAAKDVASIKATQLAVLELASFPVTSWQPKNPLNVLVDADSESIAELWLVITQIATGGFLKTARGAWLDLLVESNWDDTRRPAVATQRAVTLRNSTGADIDFNIGDYRIQTVGNLVFTSGDSVAGGGEPYTVPANNGVVDGTLDVIFIAESPGAAYNADTASWTFVDAVPGLSIDGDAVWIDEVSGTDIESDDELVARMIAKLGELAAGGNDLYYTSHSLNASNEIKRVRVRGRHPLPGQITIYLAGSSGPVSSSAVNTVQDLLRPGPHDGIGTLCADIFVESVVTNTQALTGTVFALSSEIDAAKQAVEANLARLKAALRPGAKISRERLITAIMSTLSEDDKNDLTLTTPAADVQLLENEVIAFTDSLLWTSVA